MAINRIGADDHGVDCPGALSTNFLLSSLKLSVRVSNNTLIPLYVCVYFCCLAASYMWNTTAQVLEFIGIILNSVNHPTHLL